MDHARLMKKISDDSPREVHHGLNALAKTSEFTQLLQEEVTTHRLVLEDVVPCIQSIHYDASRRISANDNDHVITIYTEDHTMAERVVLVTFLRMQGRWPYGLEWRGEKGGRRTKF